MDETSVDFGTLMDGGENVLAVHRSLVATLENLDDKLGPMVNTWSGEARNAYFAQKKQWDDAAAALGQILHQIGQAVHSSHDNYRQAESSNVGIWHG